MKHYKKHVDNFFKEKLGSYRETPPPDAWEQLESRLDNLSPSVPGASYRWLLHLGIVSVLLFLSISLVKKITGNSNTDQIAANTPTKENVNNSNTLAHTRGEETNTSNSGTQTQSNISAISQNATNNVGSISKNTNGNSGNKAGNKLSIHSTGKHITTQTYNYSTQASYVNSGASITKATNNTTNPFEKKSSTNNKYTSSLSNPSPDDNMSDNSLTQTASPNTTLSVVSPSKASATAPSKKPEIASTTSTANSSRTRIHPSFPRLGAGVKAGFESGLNNNTANKMVISPYLQYNLSRKLAIMVQPGIKYTADPSHNLASQNYYSINPENTTLKPIETHDSTFTIGSTTTRYHVTQYSYSETHDSVVKTNKTGGTSIQYELPILLKYDISKRLSVYGGLNLIYQKYSSIIENTVVKNNLTRTLDTTIVTTDANYIPTFGFSYAGSPLKDYKKLSASYSGYDVSTGFMLGFSYATGKKLLIDMLVEQNTSRPDVKLGYNINTPLSATYFRLSVGYKLTK